MSSTSETGNAKNIANFGTLIAYCESYSPAYNPSKETLKIDSIRQLYADAQSITQNLIDAKSNLDQIINNRQTAFGTVKATATRIINALPATDSPAKTIADAKSINTKIQGRRANTKTNPTEERRRISASQQSYDSLIANFANLISLIDSESAYQPNEPELKIDTLSNYLRNLRSANSEVISANVEYNNLLIARDQILYAPDTGLVDTAYTIKNYIKSLFGTQSPQYTQISKLRFTRKKYNPRFTPLIEE